MNNYRQPHPLRLYLAPVPLRARQGLVSAERLKALKVSLRPTMHHSRIRNPFRKTRPLQPAHGHRLTKQAAEDNKRWRPPCGLPRMCLDQCPIRPVRLVKSPLQPSRIHSRRKNTRHIKMRKISSWISSIHVWDLIQSSINSFSGRNPS